jgi:ATP-binding cassette subfamily A (ABC1) protein 3
MKMSGLSDNVLWLSWFATSVIKNGVVCVALVVVVKVGRLFQHSDVLVLLLFFLLFLANSIAFSFLASTFFSKARTGGVVGMIAWIALSTPSYGLGNSNVSGTAQVWATPSLILLPMHMHQALGTAFSAPRTPHPPLC